MGRTARLVAVRQHPQGAVMSSLLANLYLNPLDQELAWRGWALLRQRDKRLDMS